MTSERECFDDVIAAANSTVANNFEPVMQCIGNGRDAIDRSRCRIQLATTVIGNHYRSGAGIRRLAAIVHGLHPFNGQRTTPALGQPLNVLPG